MKRRVNLDGERIVYFRGERWLSQRDLAEASGLSEQTLHRLENGKTSHPHVETVLRVARALDVHPDELLDKHPADEDALPSVRPFPQQLIRKSSQADDFSQPYPATG